MAKPAGSTHPLGGDLYTPLNESVIRLFLAMRDKHRTWRQVCFLSGISIEQLNHLRKDPKTRAVSFATLDNMITATGVGNVHDYAWYTADDLVELGVWDKPNEPIAGFPTEWKERRRGKRY